MKEGKDLQRPEHTSETKNFDSVETLFNREATQVERDAMTTNISAKYLLRKIEELVEEKPEIFSRDMEFEEFYEALKESESFKDPLEKLEYFLLAVLKAAYYDGNLIDFVRILKEKKEESEEILHPAKSIINNI